MATSLLQTGDLHQKQLASALQLRSKVRRYLIYEYLGALVPAMLCTETSVLCRQLSET